MRPTTVTRVEATLDALSCLPNALPLSRGRRPSAGTACQTAPSLTARRRTAASTSPLGVAVTDTRLKSCSLKFVFSTKKNARGLDFRRHASSSLRRIGRLVGNIRMLPHELFVDCVVPGFTALSAAERISAFRLQQPVRDFAALSRGEAS